MKTTYVSMAIIDTHNAIIQPLAPEWFQHRVSKVDVLRLDLIHPTISGNKWFKLEHNIQHALEKGYKSILTFGGAYSNHLHATAATAQLYNIKSIGMVRGLHAAQNLTPTLFACVAMNMELVFVTKEEYAQKDNPEWLQKLSNQYNNPFIIPEGGANEYGRKGAEEIASLIPQTYTHICVSVGTGTTFIGLCNALSTDQHVIGFAPMKKGVYLNEEVKPYLLQSKNRQILDNWAFGGFGKWNETLITFMNDFYATHHIPLDMVYTAKMMYGIKEMIDNSIFPTDAKILCIHTGGLQGNMSIEDKLYLAEPHI